MDTPYIGYIAMIAFTFAPRGWAFCDGRLLPIDQNQALFSLIGTTFGGDGQTTFALPDLRGRAPVHSGQSQGPGLSNYVLGQLGGAERVTLTEPQIAGHTHAPQCTPEPGNSNSPSGGFWGASGTESLYSGNNPGAALSPQALAPAGGGQPHENRQPLLALNYVIALEGIFPSQN